MSIVVCARKIKTRQNAFGFLTFANATAFVAKLCPTFASYAASEPMFAVREQDSDIDAVRCQQSIDAVNGLFPPHLTVKAESSDLSAVFQDRIRCGGKRVGDRIGTVWAHVTTGRHPMRVID